MHSASNPHPLANLQHRVTVGSCCNSSAVEQFSPINIQYFVSPKKFHLLHSVYRHFLHGENSAFLKLCILSTIPNSFPLCAESGYILSKKIIIFFVYSILFFLFFQVGMMDQPRLLQPRQRLNDGVYNVIVRPIWEFARHIYHIKCPASIWMKYPPVLKQ